MAKFKIINSDQGHNYTHYVEAPDKQIAMDRFKAGHYGSIIDCEEIVSLSSTPDTVEPTAKEEFDGSVQYELQWNNHERRIRVNCPDEDNDIYIQIKSGKQYGGVSLSLDEAQELANYILGHVKNARLSNPD